MRRFQFSIRTVLLLAVAVPLMVFAYPHAARYFFAPSAEIALPDFQQWQIEFDIAIRDRKERESRLQSGVDTVDDAMSRFAKHDFLQPEKFELVSGWIMTTSSGDQLHRATLRRQSRLFDALGSAAVSDLLKWLDHDQIEIRYIAIVALRNITGMKPHFPHFATRQDLADHGWLADATEEYENWLKVDLQPEIAR